MVVIISTGQAAFIASSSKEFETTVYKLVDEKGRKIWNGNMSHFDESQIEFI